MAKPTYDELLLALIHLCNEAAGWREEELAEVAGWTNARCLTRRVAEARALLARIESEVTHEKSTA